MPPKNLVLATALIALVGCGQSGSAQRQSQATAARRTKLPALAIADDSPRTLVDRAIAAYGGQQNIARLQIGRVEMVGRGTFAPGLCGQFTMIDTFDLPRRLRREASFSDGKIVMKSCTVIDGDRAWIKTFGGDVGDHVREMPPPGNNNAFPHSVLGALVEMRDPAVRLTRLAGDQADVTWIAVERDSQPIGINVFENRSQRLVGTIKQLSDPAAAPMEVRTIYSDYRHIAGIDVPMQMATYRQSDLILELKVIKLDILPAVDLRLFARPE